MYSYFINSTFKNTKRNHIRTFRFVRQSSSPKSNRKSLKVSVPEHRFSPKYISEVFSPGYSLRSKAMFKLMFQLEALQPTVIEPLSMPSTKEFN